MKIVFIGGVEFSASALQELIASKANIFDICTVSNTAMDEKYR